MTVLVFSDSHGNLSTMERALDIHKNAEIALHAGDGAAAFLNLSSRYERTAFFAVRGNCDRWGNMLPSSVASDEEVLNFEGHRILLTHGDFYGVKSSPYSLIPVARKLGAEIAVFGHTHEAYDKYFPEENGKAPVRLFNPGAANEGYYGIIEIREKNILTMNTNIYDPDLRR